MRIELLDEDDWVEAFFIDDEAESQSMQPWEMFVAAQDPPIKEWVDPPAPKGTIGEGRTGGYAADGRTNTEVGDLAEAALTQFGLVDLHPGRRGGKLDAGHGKWAFEVKSHTVDATEYKIKMRASEMEEKLKYAADNGLKVGSIIVVVDAAEKCAYVYWRNGLGNFRLTPGTKSDWNFMGRANLAAGDKTSGVA